MKTTLILNREYRIYKVTISDKHFGRFLLRSNKSQIESDTDGRNSAGAVIKLCTSHLKPPHPPIRALAGHSLFMQVKVNEVPASRGQK